MAVPLLNGDILQQVSWCYMNGQSGLMVNHWRCGTPGVGGADIASVAEDLSNQMAALLKPLLVTVADYQGVGLTRLTPNKTQVFYSDASSGSGTEASDPLPPQTAYEISLRTAQAGRSYRGRKYVPFAGEGASDATGKPDAGYLASVEPLADFFSLPNIMAGAGTDITLTPVIWSRKLLSASTVEQFRLPKSWATQRRRSFLGRPDFTPFA